MLKVDISYLPLIQLKKIFLAMNTLTGNISLFEDDNIIKGD